MKIAVINDTGSAGGAGVAATRLCVGLRRRGHTIVRLTKVGFPPAPESADECYPMAPGPTWTRRLWGARLGEPWRRAIQARWVGEFRRRLGAIKPDAISLHNLHGAAWDIEVVEECLRHAPVLWTLHDMWALTGSCAYAMGCAKFEGRCDRDCPQIGVYPTLPAGAIAAAHERRQTLYDSRPPLALVAPSRWLHREATRALKDRTTLHCVPYGLDLEIFKPHPRAEAQKELGFGGDDKPTLLVTAALLNDPRKGMDLFEEAMRLLGNEALRLLVAGKGRPPNLPSHVEVVKKETIEGEAAMARIYASADLLVHPARADNQPLVVMEALACGLPVVGIDIGGVGEMVVEGETGWLAKEATAGVTPTATALADAMGRALSQRDQWPEYADRARAVAEDRFPLDLQAARYEKVFEEIT